MKWQVPELKFVFYTIFSISSGIGITGSILAFLGYLYDALPLIALFSIGYILSGIIVAIDNA